MRTPAIHNKRVEFYELLFGTFEKRAPKERQEGLRDNGRHFPRKRGVPVLVRILEIRTEIRDCVTTAG